MNSSIIYNVILPNEPSKQASSVYCLNGHVCHVEPFEKGVLSSPTASFRSIEGKYVKVEASKVSYIDGRGGLLLPSLCHSHIHLDKCYLLDGGQAHVKEGGFKEAFEGTNEAKKRFEEDDLLVRGRRLLKESVTCGVTVMRCYAEVDRTVGLKCFKAAEQIQAEAREAGVCDVQITVFAQDPLFSGDDSSNRELILQALESKSVSVLGSTPYVEENDELGEKNIEWAVSTAIKHGLHLDFHLDFHLHRARRPLVHRALAILKSQKWTEMNPGRTVQLGHCTRLSLFAGEELEALRRDVGDLPVHFAALPRSDVYMMGARRSGETMEFGGHQDSGARGTIDIVSWVRDYGFDCSLAVNNVGNGFTPHGSADPLGLLTETVGHLQRGGEDECRLLMESVTWRAKAGVGVLNSESENASLRSLDIGIGNEADFVIVGSGENKTVQSAVFSASYDRITIKDGLKVASRRGEVDIKM